jgi:hypothetical protein
MTNLVQDNGSPCSDLDLALHKKPKFLANTGLVGKGEVPVITGFLSLVLAYVFLIKPRLLLLLLLLLFAFKISTVNYERLQRMCWCTKSVI